MWAVKGQFETALKIMIMQYGHLPMVKTYYEFLLYVFFFFFSFFFLIFQNCDRLMVPCMQLWFLPFKIQGHLFPQAHLHAHLHLLLLGLLFLWVVLRKLFWACFRFQPILLIVLIVDFMLHIRSTRLIWKLVKPMRRWLLMELKLEKSLLQWI